MATDPLPKPTFSARRKWLTGFNLVLGAAALLAIIAMLNYLAAQFYRRFHWNAYNEVKLSPQTVRVLRSITNEVKATVFFGARGEPELHGRVTALLKEYNYANPRITFKSVDPTRQPGDAELVLAAHKLGALKGKDFVIFECEGRTKVIYQGELSDYDVGDVLAGKSKEFRRSTFRGEMLFTPAILNLVNPRQFKVYFLHNHGEHDPEDQSDRHGYAKFAGVLKESGNLTWEKLSLLGTNDVPPDCQLLVAAGPHLRFEDAELAKIENYLKHGGRLLALLKNLVTAQGKRSGLEKVLAQWSVGVENNVVQDPPNSPSGDDLLVAQMNTQHPIMKALMAEGSDMRPRLILPSMVFPLAAGGANPNAPKVEVLAATSQAGTETADVSDGVRRPNTYRDRQGVFPLMVAVEQGSVPGVGIERGTTRIVVVGDSLFLDNQLIDDWAPNHLFASLSVNWLLDRPQFLVGGLVPQPLKFYTLTLTRSQKESLQWIFLAAMPGGVLLLGGLVWWRRRR